MDAILTTILRRELGQALRSFRKIVGLGMENEVYAVEASQGNYIVRLNHDISPAEYPKEAWCIEAVAALGIPSPRVYGQGQVGEYAYLLQEKLPGLNGQLCTPAEKRLIWKQLGAYAQLFNQIPSINLDVVAEAEFHADWKARLDYNIGMLNPTDSLLTGGHFSPEKHQQARNLLATLQGVDLPSGLVHGDLCPRNTLLDQETIYLIDWGTAEVNIVPHTSLGLLMLHENCTVDNLHDFLRGYGLSKSDFLAIEDEISVLNLLYSLDKYRWAETYAINELPSFISKIRKTFDRARELSEKR